MAWPDFPEISAGAPMLRYPLERRVTFRTTVHTFADRSEQRWQRQAELARFLLSYPSISIAEVNALWDFFNNAKGAYAKWHITINGVEYQNCSFDTDEFRFTEGEPSRYSIQFPVSQLRVTANAIPPTLTAFPRFQGSIIGQRPFTATRRFATLLTPLDYGYRHPYYLQTSAAPGWEIALPAITLDEAGDLETHFRAARGRYEAFNFTDQLDVVHPCRYSHDELVLTYQGPSHMSSAVQLMEVPA